MATEIVRELVNGVWRTVTSRGGGDGGSQPVKTVSFPFAFDTPDIVLTGVPVYTPAAGEFLWFYGGSFLDVPAVWTTADGDPWYHFGTAGDLTAYDSSFGSGVLNSANGPAGAHAHQVGVNLGQATTMVFDDATPLTLMVDDNSGGDPGLLSGTATLVLVIGVPA